MQGVPAHHGVDLSRVTKSSEGGGVTETRPRTNVGARPSGAEEPDTELWSIPVIKTVAQSGEGVSELADTMEAHREHLLVSGELEQRREARARGRVRDVVERELRRVAWQSAAVEAELLVGLEGIARGTETPYSVASRILAGLLAGEG